MTRGAVAATLVGAALLAGCGSGGPPLIVAVPATTALTEPVATTAPIVVKPYEPTPSTEATTTTTTLPLPLGQLLPLGEGGIGRARFGDLPERALQEVSRWLEEPDEDTGWLGAETPYGTCPRATFVRMVRWGWLLLVMTDRSDYGVGREHFAGWVYSSGLDDFAIYPDGLAFPTGIGLGASVDQLRAAYPGGVKVDGGAFAVGRSFGGRLGPDGLVTRLEAGLRCPPP